MDIYGDSHGLQNASRVREDGTLVSCILYVDDRTIFVLSVLSLFFLFFIVSNYTYFILLLFIIILSHPKSFWSCMAPKLNKLNYISVVNPHILSLFSFLLELPSKGSIYLFMHIYLENL